MAEFSWMKKFLKINGKNHFLRLIIRNCQSVFGGSFFITVFLRILTLFFCWIINTRIYAQSTSQLNQDHIVEDILFLRFDKAGNEIEKANQSNPYSPVYLYLENYLEFLENLIDGNSASYKTYKTNSERRIRKIERNASDNISSLRYLAEMNFQSFALAIYHRENFTALKHFLLSLNQSNNYLAMSNHSLKSYRMKGLITIILASIPDEYYKIASIIGINENLDNGINMLEDYSISCKQNKTEYLESVILMLFVRHIFIRDFNENFEYLQNMPIVYLENPMFRLAYLLSASKAGQNDLVISILEKYPQKKDEHRICYFNYLLGESLLNQLDTLANHSLHDFLECSPGGIYTAAAYRKLAWCSLLGNDTIEFYKFRTNVITTDNIIVDADNQAVNEFTIQEIPNVDLLKARLLFDGGYYRQALEMLLNFDVRKRLKNVYEQVEYTYRLARIYHMLNDTEKAIRLYQLTLDNGLDYPLYYAANSALQLGIIYENLEDKHQAELYYNKVFDIKDSVYGYRFRHDAREGLRRLKK